MKAPPKETLERAIAAATHSPCAKSKRGVCAYKESAIGASFGEPFTIIATAFNGPPSTLTCDNSGNCRQNCGKLCVHAEARAVRQVARNSQPDYIKLVHIKVVDGQPVPGGGPSCWQCSREILDVGLGGIWLFEAQRWHAEVVCGTCNQKTVLTQNQGTTGVCGLCEGADRYPGTFDFDRTKRIYDLDSGEWRYYNAIDFHRVTLKE
jgi:deoxycytidylate deaminase